MADKLYSGYVIRNTLSLLIKHAEGFNDKTDIKKAKNRIINDFKTLDLMSQEILLTNDVFNENAKSYEIKTLQHYAKSHKKLIDNATNIKDLLEVIEGLNYYKELKWEYTTYNLKASIDDLIEHTRTIHDNITVEDSNKIIDNITINREFNIFSPRAFDGNSLFKLRNSSQNKAITFGLERKDNYHANAKSIVNRMIKGRLQGSTISNNVFDILQLTAPISWTAEYGATGALIEKQEKTALRNIIKYLRQDGLLIYTMPYTRITRDMALTFSKFLKDVQVIKKQNDNFYVYIIGVKDIQSEAREDVFKLLTTLDPNNIENEFKFGYHLASGGMKQPDFFRGSILDGEELLNIVQNSGLKSSFWKSQEINIDDNSTRPLLPFNMGQIGLVLTSGCLDGTVEEYAGQYHAIKGMVTKIRNVEETREGQDETQVETISNKVQINLLTPDGEFIELA